jgi:hypothetical protein
LAIEQIDAMSGWGDDGNYVCPHITCKDGEEVWKSVAYQPIVVAAQENAYKDYVLDEATRQENLDEMAKQDMERRKRDIEHHRRLMRLVSHGAQARKTERLARQARGHADCWNIAAADRNMFCRIVLGLAKSHHPNVKIYGNCRFKIPGSPVRWTPLEAIEKYNGDIQVYVGISANERRNLRPLQQVAIDYYRGSKEKAIEDGWQVHYLMDVLDEEFKARRFNMAWAERKMQLFFKEMEKENGHVVVHWSFTEPVPKWKENRCSIADTGFIGMYLCLKFGKMYEG